MPAPALHHGPPFRIEIDLPGEAATLRLAQAMAPLLSAGDTILLEGPIGAGKTFFARALIGALLARAGAPDEDVPSPTFTLVQTYSAGPIEVWHADLYRLSHPAEAEELGLTDAFGAALVLVEWPDRLGALAPPEALTVTLSAGSGDEDRRATLSGGGAWTARLRPLTEGGAP